MSATITSDDKHGEAQSLAQTRATHKPTPCTTATTEVQLLSFTVGWPIDSDR